MGRGYTQYAFPDTGAEDAYALYSAFLNYRLPDGKWLHVRQTECWCPTCNRIDMAECIESIEELENELARLRNPDDEEAKIIAFIGKPVEERITELQLRIIWRQNRKSPAKCLHCGSTEIVPIPDAQEFAHPATGERVVVAGCGFASTAAWYAEFTPEGDLINSCYK
jgi:hypothetical protein